MIVKSIPQLNLLRRLDGPYAVALLGLAFFGERVSPILLMSAALIISGLRLALQEVRPSDGVGTRSQ